jgi:hypothetical protein
MADYEGYLLMHDVGRHADPLYFALEGGLLRYYAKKNGRWLGEFSLTRHRAVVRPIDGGVSPNRFCLDLCPVRSVHDTDRSLKHFRRLKVVLSASTAELAAEWIRALQTWRRRNWKDSVMLGGDDELFALRMVMIMYRLDPKLLNPADVTTASLRKLGVEPESSHVTTSQTPSDKQVQPLSAADPATLLGAGVQVTRFSNRFNFRSGVSAQIVM